MKVIIDRFEGDFAVVELENGSVFANMPKALVPKEAKEGDVISITVDREETERRRQHIRAMMNKIFNG